MRRPDVLKILDITEKAMMYLVDIGRIKRTCLKRSDKTKNVNGECRCLHWDYDEAMVGIELARIQTKKRKVKKTKYKVVILRNNKQFKSYKITTSLSLAEDDFSMLLDESDKVICPVKYTNDSTVRAKLLLVNYEIVLLKSKEDGDGFRMIQNNYGEWVPEVVDNEAWVIIKREPFSKEAKFYIYDDVRRDIRYTLGEITSKILLKDIKEVGMFKTIRVVNNKIVIMGDNDEFNMIICMNKEDALRAYFMLLEASTNLEYTNLIFLGSTVGDASLYQAYSLILEHTNWSLTKIKQKTTFRKRNN